MREDIRDALRGMRRSPAFTLVAILTLALGIGANIAMFSLADTLVLKPLPVDHPENLRGVFQILRLGGSARKFGTLIPFKLYNDLRDHAGAFGDAMAFSEVGDLPIAAGEPSAGAAPASAAFVTGSYFNVLGVSAQLGRTFAPDENQAVIGSPLAIISDRFWRRALGGDPSVIGTTVRIADKPFTVIGVTPPAFFGAVLGHAPDVYLPIGTQGLVQPGIATAADPGLWFVQMVGRLAPAGDEAGASARLTGVMQASMPGNLKPVIELLPIETAFSDVRTRFLRPAQVLMMLVGTLLFIACANVAMMLLSRNLSRQKEIAVRMAIGAGAARIARQLITEGLLLAAISAAIGLSLAPGATRLLVALLPGGSTPVTVNVVVDGRVLLFTIAISIIAALLFAVVPALRAMRLDAGGALAVREHGVAGAGARLGGLLVVAQIAMALVIVSGAGLLVRTLYDLSTADAGYDTDRITQLAVNPGNRGLSEEQRKAYYRDVLDRLRSIPSVQSASMSQLGFLDRDGRTTGTIDGPRSESMSDDERMAQVYFVGPDFFSTVGTAVIRGRDFTTADMSGPRVVAINETAARRFFGDADPIGASINNGVQVIAVVGDSRYHELREDTTPAMFIPYTQTRVRERMVFSVRASADAGATLMREARAIDPLVPMRVSALREIRARSLSQERLLAVLSGFFAVAALTLLAIGLFGLVTFKVRQRTAEIGVRLALGARPDAVIWLVLRQPLVLAMAGLVAGVPATLAVTRLMETLLFGLTPGDPTTLAAATAGVLAIVAGSAAWPAWRASRLDPVIALRRE